MKAPIVYKTALKYEDVAEAIEKRLNTFPKSIPRFGAHETEPMKRTLMQMGRMQNGLINRFGEGNYFDLFRRVYDRATPPKRDLIFDPIRFKIGPGRDFLEF